MAADLVSKPPDTSHECLGEPEENEGQKLNGRPQEEEEEGGEEATPRGEEKAGGESGNGDVGGGKGGDLGGDKEGEKGSDVVGDVGGDMSSVPAADAATRSMDGDVGGDKGGEVVGDVGGDMSSVPAAADAAPRPMGEEVGGDTGEVEGDGNGAVLGKRKAEGKNPLEYLLEAVEREQGSQERQEDGDSDYDNGVPFRSAYPSPPRSGYGGGPRRAPVSAFPSRSPPKRPDSGSRGDNEGVGGSSPSRRTSMMIATEMGSEDSSNEGSGHEHDYRHPPYGYPPRGPPGGWEGPPPGHPSWQSQYGGPYGGHWGPGDYHNGMMMMGGGMPPPPMRHPHHHAPPHWDMPPQYMSEQHMLIESTRDEERLARWQNAGATEQEIQRWRQYHRTAPGRPRYEEGGDPARYGAYPPMEAYHYYRPPFPSSLKPGPAKKQKTHAELKPSRVRPYAYVGMMKDKGDPVELWRSAVVATWKDTYPEMPTPEVLNIDDAADRAKIVEMVRGLCTTKGINCFRAEALEQLLTRYHLRLFPTRNFLDVNITLSSAKLLSVESGLLSILARAIDVDDYRSITNKDNVLKWYNLFTKGQFS